MSGPSAARRLIHLLVALTVALGFVAAPPVVPEVRAALPDLTLVSNARYDVLPNERLVRVTLDIVARNHLTDTQTRRYYFDSAFLAVQPGTSNFRISSPTGDPSVRVSQQRDGYQVLALTFGQRVMSQRQAEFRLTFDMADPGGAPTRDVRVGQAFVSFPVWAFASEETPGSAVRVLFPEGYEVHVEAGTLPEPTIDEAGRTVFATGKLDDPLSFFAYFVADRPARAATSEVTAELGETDADLAIRAWPDDPEWGERVGGLFARGLPELQRLVGLPWGHEEPLVVQETVSRTTGGYAGLFDPRDGRIDVAYYADAFVVLHEAAHAWFNGSLLADRWANEAFASYYAESAGGQLEEAMRTAELTDELRQAAFPLNAWETADRADTTAEDYGYAASLELARRIARRAGHDGLRRVWAAAADRVAAYPRPAVDPGSEPRPEVAAGPPDWRGLLDLLEEQTGKRYDDLWAEWVVRDSEAGLLEARRKAREQYTAVLRAAGRWELPSAVRGALRAWEFETASTLLADARTLLDRRTELQAAAEAAGLRLPSRLETVFESDAGFEAVTAEADAEAAAIEILVDAAAARPAQPDPLQELGLVGEAPDAQLAAAREAFAAGELEQAARDAIGAQSIWQGAWEIGRNRVLIGIGVLLLVLLLVGFVVWRWRDRRRSRSTAAAERVATEAPG